MVGVLEERREMSKVIEWGKLSERERNAEVLFPDCIFCTILELRSEYMTLLDDGTPYQRGNATSSELDCIEVTMKRNGMEVTLVSSPKEDENDINDTNPTHRKGI